ncbi:hypothetical protein [Gracilibacillus sp. YIM 98692]|uniref:hypothetical protein n=1 Tax=Gracilibacillus sp. YIM 98692 TaxID=2663532 RepID=UPI0013CFBBDD|nr:hypothetical protein [Gracilibacillus sp. YIM 98692]
MHIVSAFEYNTELELALLKLEENGIHKEQIVAIPLDKRKEQGRLFDTIHRSDGISMVDLAFILGTIGMLLGIIYGYVHTWGPIFLGFMGLMIGFIIGVIIKYFYIKRKEIKNRETKIEVFLTVKCHEKQHETIKRILWEHDALAVGVISEGRN